MKLAFYLKRKLKLGKIYLQELRNLEEYMTLMGFEMGYYFNIHQIRQEIKETIDDINITKAELENLA